MRRQLWGFLAAVLGAGCQGVALRPDGSPADEKCPVGAREAMEAFNLVPGSSVPVDIDVTRRGPGPLVVYDGPVESITWLNMVDLPGHTRLYGRIWTSGPRVVIRYYKARLPDGKVIPFCAVAADNAPGLPKTPGRPGSAAVPSSSAAVYVTGQFK